MKKSVVTRVEKVWLSTREAMAYLDCSRDFLESLRSYPGFNVYRLGRSVYYEKASIDLTMRRNRV